MAQEASDTTYTVIIINVKDDAAKNRTSQFLARVTKSLPPERIAKKLDQLPWTLTRSAPLNRAKRLVNMLEARGAVVKVVPPLPARDDMDVAQTMILPGAELLEKQQMMSSTQFVDTGAPGATTGEVRVDPATVEMPAMRADSEFDIEPLSIGGILDRALQVCRKSFLRLLGILLIPWLINIAILVGVGLMFGMVGLAGWFVGGEGGLTTSLIVAGVILGLLLVILLTVVYFLGSGAIIHAVSMSYLGREVRIGDSYRFVFSRLAKFALTSALFSAVALGLMVTTVLLGAVFWFASRALLGSPYWSIPLWPPLLVAGLYCVFKMLLYDKVVIIENEGYGAALRRSWNLLSGKTGGEWPRSYFMRFAALMLLFVVFSLSIRLTAQLIDVVLTLAAMTLPETAGLIFNVVKSLGLQLVEMTAGIALSVYAAVCLVIFYYDIRNRKEGFDLQMLAEAQEGR